MGLSFVSPGKTWEETLTDGQASCTFTIERLTRDDERAIERKHTVRGLCDEYAANVEKLQRAIKAWTPGGLVVDGEPRDYDPAVIALLPTWMIGELILRLYRARPTPPPASNSGGS